jgi:cell division initiation protein
MKIAPIDIAHKTFGRKMMGLNQQEVMDFMRQVADELENVIRDRNSLRESLRERELSIAEYRERDDLLKSTITTATRMAEKIQIDADREAKLILHDAHQKSDMIVHDARDSLKKIYGEITELKRLRMQFENNLRALIQSHLTMIEQGNKVMPSPGFDSRLNLEIQDSGHGGHSGHGNHIGQSGHDEQAAIKAKVSEAVKHAVRQPEP